MNNDLISRSALLNVIPEAVADEASSENEIAYAEGWNDCLESFRSIIKYTPAVDAEPVRHGQNVTATHPSDMFVCSECGFSCEITEIRYEDGMGEPDAYEYDCKFCPNCGAKMDAEVEG